jgi:hypothetical protein
VTSSAPNKQRTPVEEVRRIVDSEMADSEKARALAGFVRVGQPIKTVVAKLGVPNEMLIRREAPTPEDWYYWKKGKLLILSDGAKVVGICIVAEQENGLVGYCNLAK